MKRRRGRKRASLFSGGLKIEKTSSTFPHLAPAATAEGHARHPLAFHEVLVGLKSAPTVATAGSSTTSPGGGRQARTEEEEEEDDEDDEDEIFLLAALAEEGTESALALTDGTIRFAALFSCSSERAGGAPVVGVILVVVVEGQKKNKNKNKKKGEEKKREK